MANTKISDMTAASALSGPELVAGVQSGANVKITASQIATFVGSALGAASATSLALGGATIGSNALAVTGPSAFSSTITITPSTEVSPLVLTGGTLAGTTSRPLIDMTQTWNGGTGLTATGFKLNITDTSSNAASLLMDLQIGGTSKVSITKSGVTTIANATAATNIYRFFTNGTSGIGNSGVEGGAIGFFVGSAEVACARSASFDLNAILDLTRIKAQLDFNSDAIIRRAAAATIQFGAADAASPVAQAMQVQSVAAGTSNTAGVDWTHNASRGTGTGSGGKIILRTAPASSTGSTQNALATGLTITAPAVNMQPSVVIGNQAIATAATDGFLYIAGGTGAPSGVPTSFTGRYPLYWDTTNKQLYVYDGAWLQPKTPAAAAIVNWQ